MPLDAYSFYFNWLIKLTTLEPHDSYSELDPNHLMQSLKECTQLVLKNKGILDWKVIFFKKEYTKIRILSRNTSN